MQRVRALIIIFLFLMEGFAPKPPRLRRAFLQRFAYVHNFLDIFFCHFVTGQT
jgi:hypothetical protein